MKRDNKLFAAELAKIASPILRKEKVEEAKLQKTYARQERHELKKLLVKAEEFFELNKHELKEAAQHGEKEAELNLWTNDYRLVKLVCQVFKKQDFKVKSECTDSPGCGSDDTRSYSIELKW